jgi:hypothetical protein
MPLVKAQPANLTALYRPSQRISKCFSLSRGLPLTPQILRNRHQAQKRDGPSIHASNAPRVKPTRMHRDRQPTRRNHEFRPPLAPEGLTVLVPLAIHPGPLDLRLAQQAEEVAQHAHAPGATAPCHPLSDSASLVNDGGRDKSLAVRVAGVLHGLEDDVRATLEQRAVVQERVHFATHVLGGQRSEPYIEWDESCKTDGSTPV